MSLFSNNAPAQDAPGASPSPAPTQPRARTREEVRANAQRQSPAEQVQSIKKAVADRRAAGDQADRQSRAREPAPETQEEVRAAAGPDDDLDSEGTFEHLDELIETLGVDRQAFLTLKAKLKVNGEDDETTLEEALGNYQRSKALTQKEQALAATRDRFLAEQTETLTALKQQFDQAKQYHAAAFQVLEAEMNQPQMQLMRQQDPASYLAWQDQFQRQKQAIQQSYQQIVANENAIAQQHKARIGQENMHYLRSRIQDFDTRERFEKMSKVFNERGVTPDEARMILDPRILHLVSDYADLKERVAAYEKAEDEAKKLAKKTPGVSARVGAPKSQDASAKKQLSAAKDAVKGLRGRNSIAAAAEAIKLVGRLPRR